MTAGPHVLAAIASPTEDRSVAVEAARAARTRGIPLVLASVSPRGTADRAGSSTASALRAATELGLRELAADLEADALVSTTWRTGGGDPARWLLESAQDASLLVAGRRHRRAAGELLLGSVAAELRGSCPVPLLLVPSPATVRTVSGAAGPVAVGVDGREHSSPVVAAAFAEASHRATDLVAVHAWVQADFDSVWRHPDRAMQLEDVDGDETRLVAEAVAGHREEHPDVQVRVLVVHGPVVPALVGASTTAQLLVVGRNRDHHQPRTGVAVARGAVCPVQIHPLA